MNQFTHIYKAALEKNHDFFATFTGCINELAKGSLLSAAATLAMEGEFEAVAFLRDKGASLDHMALGAAIGGHIAYAEKLRALGANINLIANGAARGGHKDYAERLRRQGANQNYIAYGAALGGHRDYAEELREQGAEVKFIAWAAARAGDKEYAELMRSLGASTSAIASSAASVGFNDYAEELRAQGACIDDIARGAATNGDEVYSEKLLALGASIHEIARGAAIGGHKTYAEKKRIQGAGITYIARGAASQGHQAYAEAMRKLGAEANLIAGEAARKGYINYAEKLRTKGAKIDNITVNLILGGTVHNLQSLENVLFSLPFTAMEQYVESFSSKFIPNAPNAVPRIVEKIKALKPLMQRFNISKRQARALLFAPNIIITLLQLGPQKRKLPKAITIQLTQYSLGSLLSYTEIEDLCFRLNKTLAQIHLHQARSYEPAFWTSHHHKQVRHKMLETAQILKTKIDNADSLKALSLVLSQFDDLAPSKPVKEAIATIRYRI